MKIETLEKISFDTLYTAFNEAFGNYEVQVNKDELRVVLKRRGFVPELSFGAFENNNLVSFTLNGIGYFNGHKTAYDTGTGTIEAFRGKGIASKVFTDSIPFLKTAGISQYLQENTEVLINAKNLPASFSIVETSIDNTDCYEKFWDFNPSWQNSFEAIQRCVNDFKIVEAFQKQKPVGYCIFEPNSGDITQIAVDKDYRRMGIGAALLNEAVKNNNHLSIKAINSEITCDTITAFLASQNIPVKGKQFEMIKSL